MKKSILTLFLLIGFASLQAQDKIITTEGETIVGYGTEIGPSTVYYRIAQSEDSALKKIDKKKILMVKFADFLMSI